MNNDNPYDSAAGENKTSIFVVIVNNTLRNLVCEFITRFSHLTVCGVACSVEEALVTIGQAPLQPEVALIDVFAAIESGKALFRHDFELRATGEKPTRAQRAVLTILDEAEQAMQHRLAQTTIADLLAVLNT